MSGGGGVYCIRWAAALWAVLGPIVLGALCSAPRVDAQTAARGPSLAQMGGGTISDIRIEGVQRIEPETVRSYLLIQPGESWDDERVDKSLKALFATGLFADVNLTRLGNTLVVKPVHNPITNPTPFHANPTLTV